MVANLLKRLIQAFAVIVAVAMIAFLLTRFVGDPVSNMVHQEAGHAEREAMRAELGLNDHVVVQFARFIGQAVQGDLGVSYQHRRPVAELFAERMPATIELVVVSAMLAGLIGVPLGLYAGVNLTAASSRGIMAVSLIMASVPTFVIGVLLIYAFAVLLGVLPAFGRGEVLAVGPWPTGLATVSGWKAIALPALTLALYQMTLIVRLVRNEMVEIMRADYIRFAHARGLPKRTIVLRHGLANALVPLVTIIGLNVGSLLAFSIVTESVFQWPGMGLLFVQAVGFADIPVMAAYLVLVAMVFVAINLVTDVIIGVVDPRLRAGQL